MSEIRRKRLKVELYGMISDVEVSSQVSLEDIGEEHLWEAG